MAIRFNNGEVIIVTGAGGGLGRAYALELAARGAKLVINDLGVSKDGQGADTSAAAAVVKEIRSRGGEALANADTVATPDGGKAIIDSAIQHFGRIDGVIANAGFLRDRSFAKLSFDDMDALLSVHLRAAFYVLVPAFQSMKDAKRPGSLLLTSSSSGLFGNFGQTVYGAAKAGVFGLMRSLSMEGARLGIRANAIAPIAATRLTAATMEEAKSAEGSAETAPSKVAPLAVFLMHPDCKANGDVYLAGAGWFARSAMVVASGWSASDSQLSVDSLAQNFASIRDLNDATEAPDAMATGELMRLGRERAAG